MKVIFVSTLLLVSSPAVSYSYTNWSSSNTINTLQDMQRRQRQIAQRQECMMRNQNKQQRYANCLANCQSNKEGFDSNWVCSCFKPFLESCL